MHESAAIMKLKMSLDTQVSHGIIKSIPSASYPMTITDEMERWREKNSGSVLETSFSGQRKVADVRRRLCKKLGYRPLKLKKKKKMFSSQKILPDGNAYHKSKKGQIEDCWMNSESMKWGFVEAHRKIDKSTSLHRTLYWQN